MIDACIVRSRPYLVLAFVASLALTVLFGCRLEVDPTDSGGDGNPATDAADDAASGGAASDGKSGADGSSDAKGGGDDTGADRGDGQADAGDVDGGESATDGDSTTAGAADGEATIGTTDGGTDPAGGAAAEDKFPPLDPPEGLILLAKGQDVWVDKDNKQIVIDGAICLTAGQLELLVSEEGMKTHEAVISVKAKPSTVHAGMLAIGARQGSPVKYEPDYKAATGQVIDIKIKWWDADGELHEARGQDFVRNHLTKKKLKHEWVFAGSSMWKDEFTGKVSYMADSAGDFICVSNFSSAMMDLPIESSADNEGLIFEAFTENVPPRGTRVRLILTPMPEAPEGTADKPDEAAQGGVADDDPSAAPAAAPAGEAGQTRKETESPAVDAPPDDATNEAAEGPPAEAPATKGE